MTVLPILEAVAHMLSAERNEMLTQCGSGTPMGELLRRYWYPVAITSQTDQE